MADDDSQSKQDRIIELLEEGEMSQGEIAEEVDSSDSYVSETKTKWKEEKEEEEEIQEMVEEAVTGNTTGPTPEDVYEEIQDVPSVGGKTAKFVKSVFEKRPHLLNDPRTFYEQLSDLLDIDQSWLNNILYILYPETDPAANQQQQQQPAAPPVFGGNNTGGGAAAPPVFPQGGGNQQQPVWPQQQPPQPQQNDGGNDAEAMVGVFEKLLDRMETNQQQMIDQIQNNQEPQTSPQNEMIEKMQEMMFQQMMNQIQGGDDDDNEMVAILREEIQRLREQVASNDTNQMDFSGADANQMVLSMLANRQDVDGATLASIAQEIGAVESDPEVAKKEVEKKMKDAELEAEQQKWESIMDGLENVTSQFGGLVGEALGGDEDESEAVVVEKQEETAEEHVPSVQQRMEGQVEEVEPEPTEDESQSSIDGFDSTSTRGDVTIERVDDSGDDEGDYVEEADEVREVDDAIDEFPDELELEEAELQGDEEGNAWICEKCNLAFNTEDILDAHIVEAHPKLAREHVDWDFDNYQGFTSDCMGVVGDMSVCADLWSTIKDVAGQPEA